jgi:hypothetical protein
MLHLVTYIHYAQDVHARSGVVAMTCLAAGFKVHIVHSLDLAGAALASIAMITAVQLVVWFRYMLTVAITIIAFARVPM